MMRKIQQAFSFLLTDAANRRNGISAIYLHKVGIKGARLDMFMEPLNRLTVGARLFLYLFAPALAWILFSAALVFDSADATASYADLHPVSAAVLVVVPVLLYLVFAISCFSAC
ncbi:MAG: hypothetical protein ING75_00900 [Rhodocyclaceae bacterium]|nr:hypothetical protein [Rhodocyclaceae bacterium]